MRQECCCYDIFRETSTAQRMIYCKLILVCACHMSFSSFFLPLSLSSSASLHPHVQFHIHRNNNNNSSTHQNVQNTVVQDFVTWGFHPAFQFSSLFGFGFIVYERNKQLAFFSHLPCLLFFYSIAHQRLGRRHQVSPSVGAERGKTQGRKKKESCACRH